MLVKLETQTYYMRKDADLSTCQQGNHTGNEQHTFLMSSGFC